MRAAGLLFELLPNEVPCMPNGGDLDGNGTVEFADFLVMSENFGNSAGGAASVPEPSGVTLLAAGLLLGVWRRKRS